VGLDADVADLYPAELSGGMQKRASLARAIAAEPDIIFFDEPTTGLDPIMAGVINALIREIVTEMGVTAITITHDMTSARTIADKVAMLHAGKIRWHGSRGAHGRRHRPLPDPVHRRQPRGPDRDAPMTADRLVEAAATLFWTYAGLAAIEWAARLPAATGASICRSSSR
jgi:phospholipid/cholesterol/gamma-HCH transport system ATP-binding protein